MTPGQPRGLSRPLGAPPPHHARLAQMVRQALRPLPPWESIVPDARLRAYFAHVRAEPGVRALAYILGDIPRGLAEVDIAAYLPAMPLLHLEVMHHHFREDETRPVVVLPATIRGFLIERLLAVLAVLLDHDPDNAAGDFPWRLANAAAFGAHLPFPAPAGEEGVERDGMDNEYGLEPHQMDAAWWGMFGVPEAELMREFRRRAPGLVAADARHDHLDWRRGGEAQDGRSPAIREQHAGGIVRGVPPWEGRPYHFLNWAWAERRQLSTDFFRPYGLDDNHLDLLMSVEASPRTDTVTPHRRSTAHRE